MSSYATYVDCQRFFEDFGTHYYGTFLSDGSVLTLGSSQLAAWDADLQASFDKINTMLDTIDRIPIVPIGTKVSTGSYHPALIEWNAVDTIYTKLRSRHAVEYNGNLPEWMNSFATRGMEIFKSIYNDEIALDTDTTNRGIGYPVAATRIGRATFYSNWDSGFWTYGQYPKTYRFWVIDTSNGSLPGQARYVLSHDNGFSWETGTRTTGTAWEAIEEGLAIRWENAPSLTGTQVQIAVGDVYTVSCIPSNVRNVNNEVVVRKFRRG